MKIQIMSAIILTLLLTVTLSLRAQVSLSSQGYCNSWDAVALVGNVIDGDTFTATITCVSKPFEGKVRVGVEYRVRLADINAPEINTEDGIKAWRALESLVKDRTVLLDVDDVEVFDRYGRIVAVTYVEYNRTHVLNVNKWMVETGKAMIWDHRNEFNPTKWNLYEPKKSELEVAQSNKQDNQIISNTTLITVILIIGITLTLLILLLKLHIRIPQRGLLL